MLTKIVVNLLSRVLIQCDGNVAEGRRKLGANPSPLDLFVGVVACPENTSVECKVTMVVMSEVCSVRWVGCLV